MTKMKQAIILSCLIYLISSFFVYGCRDIVKIYGISYKQTRVRSCGYTGLCCQYGFTGPKSTYRYYCGLHSDCSGKETIESEITPYQWRYADEHEISGNGKEEVILRVIDRCQ